MTQSDHHASVADHSHGQTVACKNVPTHKDARVVSASPLKITETTLAFRERVAYSSPLESRPIKVFRTFWILLPRADSHLTYSHLV